MLPVDPLYVALALLVAAVVASFVPFVPGGGLSVAGVGYYYYVTGEPSPWLVAVLVSLGLLTLAVDWLAGAVSAHVGGASLRTTAIAAVAGFVLLFVLGPLGVVLGVGGTVFAAEYYRHGDVERGLWTAAYATVGMLASSVMQALLSAVVLVGFLLAVFV